MKEHKIGQEFIEESILNIKNRYDLYNNSETEDKKKISNLLKKIYENKKEETRDIMLKKQEHLNDDLFKNNLLGF